MTRRRLEVLQWYALLGGAIAWAAQHVAGYFVSTAGCGSVSFGASGAQIGLAAAALVAIVAAEAAAFVVFRATTGDDVPPGSRLHFFAQAALLGNVLFFVIVVLNGIGTVYHLPCAQS
jgi:membrane associated rhomboid family serine protease